MAETADDPTTWPEWLLLCVARALVAQYCGSEEAAEKFLLDLAWKGDLRSCRWASSEFCGDGWSSIEGGVCVKGGSLRFLHPFSSSEILGVRTDIDWANSAVTWQRTPPDPLGPGRLAEHYLRKHLPAHLPPYHYCQRHLFHLHRDEIVAGLRAAKLLLPPPVSEVSPVSEAVMPAIDALPVEHHQQEPAEPRHQEPAPADLPPPRLTQTQDMIVTIVVRRHRRRRIPKTETIANLTRLVEDEWQAECDRRQLKKPWPPAPKRDAVKRALTRAELLIR
jgi:hypothetical protein